MLTEPRANGKKGGQGGEGGGKGGACSHNLYTFGPRPRRILPLQRSTFVTSDGSSASCFKCQTALRSGSEFVADSSSGTYCPVGYDVDRQSMTYLKARGGGDWGLLSLLGCTELYGSQTPASNLSARASQVTLTKHLSKNVL